METTGMTIRLHRGDLPDLKRYSGTVAIDTETMGLDPRRDRLCVVQLSPGDGSADVVQIPPGGGASAPNLKALLADPGRLKIFHFARFDIAMLFNALGVMPTPVYCTKIASRIARTYTDRHGLKDLVREVLGVDLSKQQQSSDWGAPELTEAQVAYAASDVLHLHGRPASISCPTAPGSIWRAGRPRTSLPIREAFRAFPGAELPRGGHIPGTFSPGALGASACPGESLPPDLIRGWTPVRRQGHAPTNESRACPDSAGTGTRSRLNRSGVILRVRGLWG